MYDPDKNQMVIKSNEIIEANYNEVPLANAKISGTWTAREMDLLNVLFSTIDPNAEDFRKIRIKTADILSVLGVTSNTGYAQIIETSHRLLTKVVSMENKKTNSLAQFHILSYAEYFHGEGYAEFCFHEKLKPFLLKLKNQYSKYYLTHILSLKSFYSKRIYELVYQYKNTQGLDGSWHRAMELNELKNFLGLEGKNYDRYSNLKQMILTPSIKDINENTNIDIQFEEIKEGRKIARIIFYAIEKESITEEMKALESVNAEILELLKTFNFSPKVSERIIKENDADFIKYVISRYEKAKKVTEIKNPAGWLVSALSNDFVKTEYAIEKEQKKKKKEALKGEKKQEEKEKNLKAKYKEYLTSILNNIAPERLEVLKTGFIQKLKEEKELSVIIKRVETNGFLTAGMQKVGVAYLQANAIELMSLEEYEEVHFS